MIIFILLIPIDLFLKKVDVEKAPFGIYSEKELDFIVVTNVQSNSISVIDKTTHNLIKNIKSRRLAISSCL